MIYKIYKIALRECRILMINPVYLTCMIVFPVIVTFFFTTLMNEGQPQEMPVGVVDLDKTSTSRNLIRRLDGFQTSNVVAYYPNVNEARRAIQRNEIYAFLYIPNGTTSSLFASRQPKISLYYSNVSLTAGALLFKDLKTVALLGSAGVGQATMRAKGFTDDQIKTFLQPIALDLHMINNPWANYNMYLSTMLIPGILMLFMFFITTYTSGVPIHLLCVYVLSVWIPAIPPSWRRVDADAIGIVGSPVFHRLRDLHLRDSTVTTYVHECLFTLGNVGIHHMRRDIPCLCHEPCHRGNSTALSATSLQHDIPDLCLQWFPVR